MDLSVPITMHVHLLQNNTLKITKLMERVGLGKIVQKLGNFKSRIGEDRSRARELFQAKH